MSSSLSQINLIREAFLYQSRFEGSTMVFKIDFPVTEDPGFPSLMKDLALLAKTGFRIVIVPGAKESIDTVLKQHEIISTFGGGGDSGNRRESPGNRQFPLSKWRRFMLRPVI